MMLSTMFSPVSLEAQKLISVSIGKINASRVTRTGASLHRSLLVASVLHKARNVYLEEERERAARYSPPAHCCPTSSPELTVTPVMCQTPPPPPPIESQIDVVSSEGEDRLSCHEDEVVTPERGEESKLPQGEASTDTTATDAPLQDTTTTTTAPHKTSHARKRRRVSDQETAAAISSILPKRLRSEVTKVEQPKIVLSDSNNEDAEARVSVSNVSAATSESTDELSARLSAPEAVDSETKTCDKTSNTSSSPSDRVSQGSSEDSDSDSDDSASDTSTTSCEEMEVDQLTSLVSYFSFSQSQQKSDYCLSPIHSQAGHVVALTA